MKRKKKVFSYITSNIFTHIHWCNLSNYDLLIPLQEIIRTTIEPSWHFMRSRYEIWWLLLLLTRQIQCVTIANCVNAKPLRLCGSTKSLGNSFFLFRSFLSICCAQLYILVKNGLFLSFHALQSQSLGVTIDVGFNPRKHSIWTGKGPSTLWHPPWLWASNLPQNHSRVTDRHSIGSTL